MSEKQDKKLLGALRACAKGGESASARDAALKKLDAATQTFLQPSDVTLAKEIGRFLMQKKRSQEIGTPAPFPLEEVLRLSRSGYPKSAEFVLLNEGAEALEPHIERLLASSPSTKVIDALAKKSKGMLRRAGEILSGPEPLAGRGAVLEWFIKKAKGAELQLLVPRLIGEISSDSRNAVHSKSLAALLAKDKKGNLWQIVLRPNERRSLIDRHLQELLVADSKLAESFLAVFAKLLKGPEGEAAVGLLEQTAPHILTSGRKPEARCGQFAVIVGTILKSVKRNPAESRMLEISIETVPRFLSETEDGATAHQIWLTAPVAALKKAIESDTDLSFRGAKLLADSLEKARQGVAAGGLLEALALNLGMKMLGTEGEKVKFDPDHHEDTEGGLLRGDDALVVRAGWNLEVRTVGKAAVRRQHA